MTEIRDRGRSAAHLLVDCLAAEGCEYVFSVPGEETMDVLDALAGHPQVRHVTTRHEQGAAFMADVHGRLTGRCAVAMATLGPGATNLVTGIADAYLDRAPMVALTGQTGIDKVHKESHQYVDIVRMLEPVTKWNARVERAPRHPRDGAQGVPRGPPREARPDPHRAARGHRRDRGRRRARATAADADLLPRAHRRGDLDGREAGGGQRAAADPGRERRPAPERLAGAAGARPRAARARSR